jgi:5-amino-6-(5-phosphoribosylamino)uracil reductase
MPVPGLFSVLLEREEDAPRCALEEEYGAPLLVGAGRIAVNFVSTIDGVASLGMDSDDSRAVGGGVAADRTLMAMLRAVAGVIVVGAGTLRATRNHQWTAITLAPGRARDLAILRAAAGRPAAPAPLLVVSRTGELPADAVALTHPAVPVHVVTAEGAVAAGTPPRLRGGPAAEPDAVSAAVILAAARDLAGGGALLCEGGPHLFGTLLEGGVPVDLFLTIAPQLVGISRGSAGRRSLVEGVELPPFARPGELRSVRRAGDHLLLRYTIGAAVGAEGALWGA